MILDLFDDVGGFDLVELNDLLKKIETLVCIRCRLKRQTGSKARSRLAYQQTKQRGGRTAEPG